MQFLMSGWSSGCLWAPSPSWASITWGHGCCLCLTTCYWSSSRQLRSHCSRWGLGWCCFPQVAEMDLLEVC